MFTKLFKGFRKFTKFLFSRVVLVGLSIILQIVWLWILLELVEENYEQQYYIIRYVTAFIGIVLSLIIINKDEPAEYKLPWLAVTIAFPLLGLVLFVFFGNNQPGILMKKHFRKLEEENRKYFLQDEESLKKLGDEDPAAKNQAQYLYESSRSAVHADVETRYFAMGEDMFPVLIEELKKAKRFIFMEYFILQEGKFWNTVLDVLKEKAAEGVEVRVMYDDVGSIGKVSARYAKKLRKAGLKAQTFRPFRPIITTMHNNRDHRKITVIDNAVAFTGGINLADEYINEHKRFGVWKDTAVMLRGNVSSVTAVFLTMWDMQARKRSDYDEYVHYRPEEPIEKDENATGGYACFYNDGPKPFYDQQVGKNVYLNILNAATDYVYIASPYLICDNELLSALRLAARRGVDVRLVTPKIPDKKIVHLVTRSNYSSLLDAGVKIYEYTPGFIHAKNFVADDKIATVSTVNLDYRSLVHHFECGVWLYRTPTVAAIKEDMVNTFAISEEITPEHARLNPVQLLVKSIVQILTPLL